MDTLNTQGNDRSGCHVAYLGHRSDKRARQSVEQNAHATHQKIGIVEASALADKHSGVMRASSRGFAKATGSFEIPRAKCRQRACREHHNYLLSTLALCLLVEYSLRPQDHAH